MSRRALYSNEENRECSKCGAVKPREQFFRHSQRSDGLHSWCKECCKEGSRKSLVKKYATFEGRITTFLRTCKVSAEKRGQEFSLTRRDFEEMWRDQYRLCAYSGIEMTTLPAKLTSVSVERIDNKVGYTRENTVLVCNGVNRMKSDMEPEEFFNFCKSVSDWLSDDGGNLCVEFVKYDQ